MTPESNTLFQWRPLIIGVAAGGFLLLLAFTLQHFRHGWPFSLHHDMSAETETLTEPAAPSSEKPEVTSAETRVAVEIDSPQSDIIGIRLEKVTREPISQPLRVVATVVPDETRVSHVHARVAGWLEQLYVNTTGQEVRAGEPLAGVFSQELFATQAEYLSALKTAKASPQSAVVEGAKTRLTVLGMTENEIADITRKGEARRLVTLTAPRSGVVLQRSVSAGTSVDPSTPIFTVADLSRVWVWAEVPESSAKQVTMGTTATLDFPNIGHQQHEARVDFLYPTLTERTRTLRVRFSVPNTDGVFRPGLYGTAIFHNAPREALTISRDAVVDTGLSQHVFIAVTPNRFEPRNVTLGTRLQYRVEVIEGLSEGEDIVASGVFLLDSESRLRASGGAGTGHSGHSSTKITPQPESHKGHNAAPGAQP